MSTRCISRSGWRKSNDQKGGYAPWAGFLGIGGSSAKTDRKATLQGFGDLSNIFNFGLDTSKGLLKSGTADTGTGVNALTTGIDYFKKLASGDRSTVAGAIAPETNAVLAKTDASRRNQVAAGTARGGGTASADQQAHDAAMAEIDNYLFGVRPGAAKEVADIGGKLAGVGLGETQSALGFGDLAETGAANLAKTAAESRKTSYEINQDTVAKVTQAIDAVLMGIG